MKKIMIITLVVMAVLTSFLIGEQTYTLTEVLKPDQLVVSGDRCFILQGATVFIYDLKEMTFIKKFGKKGEGPGEILSVPFISNGITAFDNKILIDAINKAVIFNNDGTFVKEFKKKGRVANVLPVGDGYVVTRLKPPSEDRKKVFAAVTLVDAEINVSKELHLHPMARQGRDVQMLSDVVYMGVYENKIFVEKSTEGFVIDVYDSKGNALYTIRKDIPPLKVTAKDKEIILQEFLNDRVVQFQMKQLGETWEQFKKRINIRYPDTFSPIRDILVRDGKIYVRTYITKDGKEKYHILDLKGNELKTVFLPKPILAALVMRLVNRPVRFYDIAGDYFYYLVENEDEEEWEIHVEKI